mmetsp:Transcript_22940/g.60380  ORF Transcript_22940/g.60380 Transcript_22940/m.60380 type:complete len:254 (-) Transcript_22940:472-1233(-)
MLSRDTTPWSRGRHVDLGGLSGVCLQFSRPLMEKLPHGLHGRHPIPPLAILGSVLKDPTRVGAAKDTRKDLRGSALVIEEVVSRKLRFPVTLNSTEAIVHHGQSVPGSANVRNKENLLHLLGNAGDVDRDRLVIAISHARCVVSTVHGTKTFHLLAIGRAKLMTITAEEDRGHVHVDAPTVLGTSHEVPPDGHRELILQPHERHLLGGWSHVHMKRCTYAFGCTWNVTSNHVANGRLKDIHEIMTPLGDLINS